MFASTRFLPRVGVFVFLVSVGINLPTDSTSTRRVYGYGGMVLVPPAVEGSAPAIQTPDILNQRRIAVRTKNGRVLYANERITTPAAVDEARAATARVRHPCTQLVQLHSSAGPNS
ncbi:MAG TPA: hypothetical protein VJW73_02260 [Gemmatimonadaceae bacterium]|nr:hypothetical protein [Gemmatimonadaceae bacterium]